MTYDTKLEWQTVLDMAPTATRRELLRQVLRMRRRYYPVGVNGHISFVSRSVVRDYLKENLG